MRPGDLMVVDTRDSNDTGASLYRLLDDRNNMLRIGWLEHSTVVLVLSHPRRLAIGRHYVLALAGGGEVGWVMEQKLVEP